MKARVITIAAQGAPSVMELATVELAPPAPEGANYSGRRKRIVL